MSLGNSRLWAGSDEGLRSLQTLFESNASLLQSVKDGTYRGPEARRDQNELDDWGDAPESIQIVDSIGIVSFSGAMVRSETWLTRLMGVTTYEGIQNAIAELANNTSVKAVVVNANTPGGLVEGVAALSEWIAQVDKNVKPIYGYTSSELLSAGYWALSGVRRLYAGKSSNLGSVGIIAQHIEITEQLKMMGIKVSVFRSAPFKALMSKYEKLSPEASDEIKESIAEEHENFVGSIVSGRKLDAEYVRTSIATGKVFSEDKALAAKMIDGIASLDVVVGKLAEQASKGSFANRSNSSRASKSEAITMTGTVTRKPKQAVAFPADTLALMALGITLPTDAIETGVVITGEVETPADGETPTVVAAPAAVVPAVEPPAAETPTGVAAVAAAPAVATPDPVVALLQGQLATAQTEANTLRTQVAQHEATIAATATATAAAAASTASLEASLRTVIQRMAIGLGTSVVGLEAMTGGTLAAQFTALNTELEKRFPVGRQTAASGAVPAAATNVQTAIVTPAHMAGIRATGLPGRN